MPADPLESNELGEAFADIFRNVDPIETIRAQDASAGPVIVEIELDGVTIGGLKEGAGRVWSKIQDGGATVDNTIREKAGQTADYVKQRSAAAGDYIQRRGAALEFAVRTELGRAVDLLKESWWYQSLQKAGLDLFMQPPNIIQLGEHYGGEPVYYVNGMATTRSQATDGANALANHLKRPVYLIYNPTVTLTEDLAQCVYDRAWVVDVLVLMSQLTEITIGAVLGRKSRLQWNQTTREVSHLLYHRDAPLSIVSHSQGCLIVRNACFTLFLLGREGWVRNRLAWVAAGNPFNDGEVISEVWPRAKRLKSLRNANDFVATWVALSGITGDLPVVDHDFIGDYVSQISPDMLWPSEGGPQDANAPAATPTVGVVTASVLNVRARPGTGSDAPVLKQVVRGTQLQILGRDTGGQWLLVALAGSKEPLGWVSAEWVDLPVPVLAIPQVPVSPPGGTPAPGTSATPAARILTGKIAVPVFDSNRQAYDIYFVDANGQNLRKIKEDASQPSLSPDGRSLVFRHWRKDDRGLVVTDTNGRNALRVTNFFEDVLPCWASDSKHIVFSSYRESDRKSRIYHVWSDRMADWTIKRGGDAVYGQEPFWLRDNRILYRITWPNRGFVMMNPDGENPVTVYLDDSAQAQSVSPDNATIVFMSKRSGAWDILRVGCDGRNLRQLTTNSGNNGLPAWSPDGQVIAFVSDRGGGWGLWVMNPDGSDQRKLLGLPGSIEGRVRNEPDYLNHGWMEEQISWSI